MPPHEAILLTGLMTGVLLENMHHDIEVASDIAGQFISEIVTHNPCPRALFASE